MQENKWDMTWIAIEVLVPITAACYLNNSLENKACLTILRKFVFVMRIYKRVKTIEWLLDILTFTMYQKTYNQLRYNWISMFLYFVKLTRLHFDSKKVQFIARCSLIHCCFAINI